MECVERTSRRRNGRFVLWAVESVWNFGVVGDPFWLFEGSYRRGLLADSNMRVEFYPKGHKFDEGTRFIYKYPNNYNIKMR